MSKSKKIEETIKAIKNENDYTEALKKVNELKKLKPRLGTPENNKLSILIVLISKYEEKKQQI